MASARVGLGEPHLDALARQHMGEQRVGGAVELRHGHDVAAAIGQVGDRIIERGLAGADRQGPDAAFERRDARFEHRRGRIGDAAVAIAFGFEVEQGGAVIGAVERIGDGLIDRHRDRLGGRVVLETAVKSPWFRFALGRLCVETERIWVPGIAPWRPCKLHAGSYSASMNQFSPHDDACGPTSLANSEIRSNTASRQRTALMAHR